MKAFIDVGNSNVDIYLIENSEIKKIIKFVTVKNNVDTYYELQINNNLKNVIIEDGIISSVVPDVTKAIVYCFNKLYNVNLTVVTPSMKTNLKLDILEPNTLGADLLCDVVGAKKYYGNSLVICDLGTCTKLLVIDKEGNYIGGIINPGVVASLDSMFNNAALLDKFTIKGPSKVIGNDTESCITSGIYFGTASLLDGMITKMEKELGYSLKVILTGGLAESLKDYLEHEYILDKNLLLNGLIELYNLNK